MKKIVFALGLAIATLNAAQAQNAAPAPVGGQLRGVVGLGITAGGDQLATASYVKGGSIDIDAGGGVVFVGGVDYVVNDKFSFQGTVNFHVDNANAKNGSIKFQRFPIEVAAYFHPSAEWRIGGGVRYVASPKLSSSGVASGYDDRYKNTVSPMLEVEYLYAGNIGFKLRAVSETIESKYSRREYKANHVGLFANYYF